MVLTSVSFRGFVLKRHHNVIRPTAYIIFFLGAFFYCYEYFLRIAPAVMQLPLMRTFHIDATLFGTLSAFYFYAYTPTQLFAGIIVDRFSTQKVLIAAILACTLGSFMMASTHTYSIAAAGRFLQGFGSAFAFVGGLKLVAMWLPSSRFAFYSSFVNMLGFLGACVGTISISILVQHLGWHDTVQDLSIVGVVLALCFWLTSHVKNPRAAKVNMKASSFRDSWDQLKQVVVTPRIWLAGLYSGLMFLPTTVFAALWGVPYLEAFHHYSSTAAATAASMIFLGWAVGAVINGWLSDRLHCRLPIMRVGALLAFLLTLPLLYLSSISFGVVCLAFLAFGAVSSVQILSFVVAKDLSPSHRSIGTAVAFINTITMIGGMVFQRGLGEILDCCWSGATSHGIPVYSLHDYQCAVTVVPVSIFLALVLSLFIKDSLSNEAVVPTPLELTG